eukprot:2467964-Rhodomonas_salina.2
MVHGVRNNNVGLVRAENDIVRTFEPRTRHGTIHEGLRGVQSRDGRHVCGVPTDAGVGPLNPPDSVIILVG